MENIENTNNDSVAKESLEKKNEEVANAISVLESKNEHTEIEIQEANRILKNNSKKWKKENIYLLILNIIFIYILNIDPWRGLFMIGWWFFWLLLGKSLVKKNNRDTLTKIFTRVSLVSWIIPPLWFFISSVGFYLQDGGKTKSYYINVITFIISLANWIRF